MLRKHSTSYPFYKGDIIELTIADFDVTFVESSSYKNIWHVFFFFLVDIHVEEVKTALKFEGQKYVCGRISWKCILIVI